MSIRRSALTLALTVFAAGGIGVLASGAARAEVDEVRECATQYQAAKAADKLNGQPWQDFFPECKAKLAGAPTAAAPEEPAPAPKVDAAKPEPVKTESPKAEPAKTEAPAAPEAKAPAPAPEKPKKHPKHKAK